MARIIVEGNGPLRGQVRVSGSKNAVLPILAATLLADEPCRIGNVPALADVQTSLELLGFLGALAERPAADVVEVDSRTVHHQTAPYELVRQMRASIVVLGPLLTRFGRAEVSMPGGCQIGGRPVDQHLKGLAALGAEIAIEGGYIHAKARRLRGARVVFDLPTVTGTENLIMAAVLASGETVLENCACEPEIVDLVGFLRVLGAEIDGAGTPTIRVQGREGLGGGYYAVQSDRIEAGTFLVAAAITGGDVEVLGARAQALGAVLDKLQQAGAEVVSSPDSVRVIQRARPRAVDIDTAPFPGFPTDMQAQFCALNAVAEGRATIRETVFENRFMHVPELRRFGAQIEARGDTVTIDGLAGLSGAPVMATDLRASACLVLAGLIAEGQSVIDRVYHLDRGYERIEQKLSALGAKIWRA